jgi:hypothetical protein
MEYRVIEVISRYADKPGPAERLKNAVNEAIAQGWVPLGGVSVHGAREDGSPVAFLYQAMTRSRS